MEFTLGYLLGSGATWPNILLVVVISVGILVLIKAITGKDLS